MRSRTVINVTLLAAILCFTLVLSLTDREDVDDGSPRRLSSKDPASVTSISIKPRSGAHLSIQRTGNTWRLGQDGKLRANPYRVNAILDLLQTPLISSLSPEGLKLQAFSLDRPLLELTIDDAVFLFGAEAPLGQGRYVLFDNRINIIADKLYPQLQQDPSFFVSTELFDDNDPPERMACKTPLQKDEGPGQVVIATAWQRLQASRVTAVRQDLQKARLSLSVTTRSGKTLHIIPESSNEELILSVIEYGMAYHLPASMLKELGIAGMDCFH